MWPGRTARIYGPAHTKVVTLVKHMDYSILNHATANPTINGQCNSDLPATQRRFKAERQPSSNFLPISHDYTFTSTGKIKISRAPDPGWLGQLSITGGKKEESTLI